MFSSRHIAYRRRVVVSLKMTNGSERSIAGVLWSKGGTQLVLKDSRLLEPGREPLKIDGEVVIEKSNVDFVQILPEV